MSILIKGVDMPDNHHIYGCYICGDGRVLDISRRNVIGEVLQYDQPEIVRCTEENDFCSYAKGRADGV